MMKRSKDRDDEAEVLTRISSATPQSKHLSVFKAGLEKQRECCGVPCVAIEFIDGSTLADLIKDHGITYKNGFVTQDLVDRKPAALQKLTSWLDFAQLRDIMLQSLVAFCDLEKLGVCNGDQNLRNVMLERGTGRIVFIDFGYARLNNPGTACLPDYPFQVEVSSSMTPQTFPTLGYLLQDSLDAASYQRMCNRLRHASSACLALHEETLRPPGSAAANDGSAFFGLHSESLEAQLANVLQERGKKQSPQETHTTPQPVQTLLKQSEKSGSGKNGVDKFMETGTTPQSTQGSSKQSDKSGQNKDWLDKFW